MRGAASNVSTPEHGQRAGKVSRWDAAPPGMPSRHDALTPFAAPHVVARGHRWEGLPAEGGVGFTPHYTGHLAPLPRPSDGPMLFLLLPVFVLGFVALGFAAGFAEPAVWSALVGRTPSDAPGLRGVAAIAGATAVIAAAHLCARLPLRAWTGLAQGGSARVGWPWILGLCALLGYLSSVGVTELENVISRVTDFGTFYRASVAVAQHADPYVVERGEYFYPPTFAYLIRPLTCVPITWASLLWFMAKLMMLTAMVRWAFDLLDGIELDRRHRVWFSIGMLTATARFWIADLQYGNTNLLVTFLLLGGVWLDLRRRSPLAGVLVALAATVKVVPGLMFVWFLARGRSRAIGWGAAVGLAVNLLPLALEPAAAIEVWTRYVDHGVVGKLSGDLSKTDNQSLWGMLSRVLVDHPAMVRMVWALISLPALGGLIWLTVRLRARPVLVQSLGAALTFALILVVSPGSWVVHHVAAFFPMAALLRWALRDTAHRRLYLWVFLLAYIPLTVSGWWRSTVELSLDGSWFLATMLVVVACLSLAAVSERPTGTAFEES